MDPKKLAEYLRVLRDAQLMSAEVVIPSPEGALTIRAVFAPEFPGVPVDKADEDPSKWAWKGDQ